MFDLDRSDEAVAVDDLCRSLARDLLEPAARHAESSELVPQDVRRSLWDTGLVAPVDEAFGGGGRPTSTTVIRAVEALAGGDPGIAMSVLWSGAVVDVLARVGAAGAHDEMLKRFASEAHAHGAVALYEGFGRAPSESATTVSKEGERWRVRGTKVGVAGATDADPLLVFGLDPASNNMLRVAIVDSSATRVHASSHLALGAARLSTIDVDTLVTADALVGGEHPDPVQTALAIAHFRLLNAAAMIGTAQRSIDYASKYATERVAFGKAISAFQGVSFMIADAALRIGAARLEVHDIAARIDARDADGLERACTDALNYVGRVATEATRDAIQVLGGHGFIKDHPVELWYRSAATLAALDFDPLCSSFEAAL